MKNFIVNLVCLFVILLCGYTAHAHVVLVGGNLEEDNAEVFDKIIELAGGVGVAKIGCICTASADPEDSGLYYEDLFNQYGALEATYIPVTETSNNADDPEIVALIRNQTGFFFGGGDQGRIPGAWKRSDNSDTLALAAMRDVVNAGGVIGGTSAGAACQGTGPMIEGGLSWQALVYGAYAQEYDPNNPDILIYVADGGLGFVPDYLVDTHFSERGREGRITKLLLDTNNDFAIAIDENTGVHIAPTGECEVLGTAGGVMIIDVTEAILTPSIYTTVSDVRISYLTEDDKFDINNGTIAYASWKSNMEGNQYYLTAISSDDIFTSPYKPISNTAEFRKTAHYLYDSKQLNVASVTFESDPTFTITLRKSDSEAYGGDSPFDNSFQITYKRMIMDIVYA